MGIVFNFCENYDFLSNRAADIVGELLKAKPDCVLGLPTGSTPIGMYKKLIEKNKSGEIDFSKVTTFNLDEYYPIKKTSEQSYYKFMFDNLFDGININPDNINIPDGEAENAEIESLNYERKIDRAGGLDLMILGIGPNGHIGFNEPGKFLLPHTHVADLTEDTIKANARFFDSESEVPKTALTMGMGSIIAKSKKILLLVSGESKKAAFDKFYGEAKITADNPSTFLYLHGDVIVLSDIS
ncbi:MAG: glucosamine-6-phosphate deaminase [Oscillospiraceae bacterium]|nr:glucosamine-6-phosphate deaminase [Oscillospiraceae bacterium]